MRTRIVKIAKKKKNRPAKHIVFTDLYFLKGYDRDIYRHGSQGATPGSNVFKAHVSFLSYLQFTYLQQVIKTVVTVKAHLKLAKVTPLWGMRTMGPDKEMSAFRCCP